jgi:hypothetical protein
MTETSDSGFTEINQSRSSDGSQCDKSGNTSPALNSMDESNSQAANSENILMAAGGENDGNSKGGEESNTNSDSNSSSSEDSDDDYEDSDQDGKKGVLSWVSQGRFWCFLS